MPTCIWLVESIQYRFRICCRLKIQNCFKINVAKISSSQTCRSISDALLIFKLFRKTNDFANHVRGRVSVWPFVDERKSAKFAIKSQSNRFDSKIYQSDWFYRLHLIGVLTCILSTEFYTARSVTDFLKQCWLLNRKEEHLKTLLEGLSSMNWSIVPQNCQWLAIKFFCCEQQVFSTAS